MQPSYQRDERALPVVETEEHTRGSSYIKKVGLVLAIALCGVGLASSFRQTGISDTLHPNLKLYTAPSEPIAISAELKAELEMQRLAKQQEMELKAAEKQAAADAKAKELEEQEIKEKEKQAAADAKAKELQEQLAMKEAEKQAALYEREMEAAALAADKQAALYAKQMQDARIAAEKEAAASAKANIAAPMQALYTSSQPADPEVESYVPMTPSGAGPATVQETASQPEELAAAEPVPAVPSANSETYQDSGVLSFQWVPSSQDEAAMARLARQAQNAAQAQAKDSWHDAAAERREEAALTGFASSSSDPIPMSEPEEAEPGSPTPQELAEMDRLARQAQNEAQSQAKGAWKAAVLERREEQLAALSP